MNSLQILSFVGFTLLVAVITWSRILLQQDAYQKDNHQNPPIFSQPVHAYFLLQNHSSGDELFHDTLIHTGK